MRAPLSLGLYRLATYAVTPIAPMLLRSRGRHGKEDMARLDERLGRSSVSRPPGPLVWLHGISVGESLSFLPLIERIRTERPEVGVLVTSGTRASADILAKRLPASVVHQYAPLDLPAAVNRFLDHWRPDLAVFAESELWPNLILGAALRGTKLALVSARLSERSLQTWRRAPRAARALLGTFDLVLARDSEAARRLSGLGVRVDGAADLKLGAEILPVDTLELERLRSILDGRPTILAASTHPGEEAAVLDRFITAASPPCKALLVIAPRHIERGPMIAGLARERGLASALRSQQPDPTGLDIYIADTLGEFGLWYRLARLAFLGGSLDPGFGGHNPLEPARLGCPVVSGDRIENWPIYRELEQCGAVRLIDRPEGLDDLFRQAIGTPGHFAAMAQAAQAYVWQRDAETAVAISRIVALLNP